MNQITHIFLEGESTTLNSSAFSLKSVINLFSCKIVGMQGTFLPVRNLFKIDQHIFELILGSNNFLTIFENDSCVEVSFKLLSLLLSD